MDNRELFHASMKHENGNKLLHIEQGFNIVYKQWKKDGLPENVENTDLPTLSKRMNLFDYMNVTGFLYCDFDQFCIPTFKEKTLSESSDRRTYRNSKGVILMERTVPSIEGTQSFGPPNEIDFAIKNMIDYQKNRYRFIGNIEDRIDDLLIQQNAEAYRTQQDYLTTLWVHGPFGFLRDIIGTVNAMILPYDEPEMIEMMLSDHLETSMAAAEKIIREYKPDVCFIWEDCCGRSGPFITPKIFDQFMAPWYREWKSYLKSLDVHWLILDTDGDPSPLVTRWYEAGIDCMLPWEVNAVDMLKFAEEYPYYTMMGGIYKHMFEPGDPSQVGHFKSTDYKKVIDEELERVLKPMTKRSGYIAALDHWAFWGTTFEGYKHYCKRLWDYGKSNVSNRSEIYESKIISGTL